MMIQYNVFTFSRNFKIDEKEQITVDRGGVCTAVTCYTLQRVLYQSSAGICQVEPD